MSDLSFLENDTPQNSSELNDRIKAISNTITERYNAMIAAEEAYTQAKNAYDMLMNVTLPGLLHSMNITSLETDKFSVSTKLVTHVSVPKANKEKVATWAEQYDPALVTKDITVSISDEEALKQSGIAYRVNTDINTNRLKKFLLDACGFNGGQAIMAVSDIPKTISFFQKEEGLLTPKE